MDTETRTTTCDVHSSLGRAPVEAIFKKSLDNTTSASDEQIMNAFGDILDREG
ncbi:hypothetical protein [Streptomyces sp. NPDC090029]|uniref:hypothetical protein n=1 Tax=Streptomyces sp. NPDC090029 TaxID=3365924 RepID=UPI0037FD3503